jgi:putative transposase
MARKLRVQYPGAVYHVMNRGDQREPIFQDDQDRLLLLETLGEACAKTDWQIHAWCLMSHHFHLVSETPRGNLVFGMQWLLGVYTSRFNAARDDDDVAVERRPAGHGGGDACCISAATP